jgi:hypothetical protein
MATRAVMTTSAVVMGVAGLAATFFPAELLLAAGQLPSRPAILLVQVIGALYLGFAVLNWMTRGYAIGGIYGRPLSMANLLHFLVAALAVIKLARVWHPPAVVIAAFVYTLFAVAFGAMLVRAPDPPAAPTYRSGR